MRELRIAMVEWVDSHTFATWSPIEGFDDTVPTCISVGWLISKTKDAIVIAGHISSETDQCSGDVVIPASSVRNFRFLPNPKIQESRRA